MNTTNKVFRILKVLACVVLLFGLCTAGVSAETIDLVAVTGIDAPIAGAKPDYNGTIANGAKYDFGNTFDADDTRNGIAWEDNTTGDFLDPDTAVFEAGHRYTVWVHLVPKVGNEFPYGGEVEGYINGDPAVTAGSIPEFCNIYYTFPTEPIKEVAITGIQTPREGCLPDDDASVEGVGYHIADYVGSIIWQDITGNTLHVMEPGEQFEQGHEYTVIIYLETESGYHFATIPSGDRTMVKATVNGKGAMVMGETDASHEITVSYTFKKTIDDDHPFQDVTRKDYFYEPVLWASALGITVGVSDNSFAPGMDCTRGQIVTFLWRAYGSPEPVAKKNPFHDVKESDYFYEAVLWAVEKGITAGTSATTFSPGATCTRAQAVTFLWRSQRSPVGYHTNPFTDVPAGKYYTDAVLWAVANEITAGTSATTFSPENTCTRGQIVTFLYRCMEPKK